MTRGGESKGAIATLRTTPSVGTYTYADAHPSEWNDRQRLQYLLDKWGDIFEPDIASSLSSQLGGGSGLEARLPAMAHHRSVIELERCLEELREQEPALHGHLKAFRCRAEWRQVRAKIRVKLSSGRWDEIDGWKRERIVPAWISLVKVAQAERLLLKMFQGQVFIPQDLWDGLVKPVVTAT